MEPSIREVYFFPAEDEIRLIELDPATPPSDVVAPFYFRADPSEGITFTMAIAAIRPEEKDKLSPPADWGDWDAAEKIA